MRVIITGAAGEIGGQIVEELSGSHELCLVDRHPVAGRMSMIADLSKSNSWMRWLRRMRVSEYPQWMEAFSA